MSSASRAGLLPLLRSGSGSSSYLAFTSGDSLASSLQSQQYGRPLALGAVLQDAISRGDLVHLKDFQSATKSIYTRSWLPSASQILNWSLRQIGLSGDSDSTPDKLAVGDLVVLENVEAAAQAILKQAQTAYSHSDKSSSSRVYSRSRFESEFTSTAFPDQASPLSSTDISILLTYLTRDKPSISTNPTSTVIKFSFDPSTPPDPVTEQDTTTAHLTDLVTSLESQTASLTASTLR